VASPSPSNRGPSAGPENRRALVAAAREIFATEGYAAPLSSIAKRAGVGQGSLYRHFPDRTALAVAVFDENLTVLEQLVAMPDTTLDDLLERIVQQSMTATALISMATNSPHDPRLEPIGERFAALADVVVERERSSGRIRADVRTDDVILAIEMLSAALVRTDPDQRAAVARRAWSLFHAAFAPR
jgi:AcrR family transcriptional regulator